jgi:hypothetical protein
LFGKPKHTIGKTGEKLPEQHDGLPDSTIRNGLCPRCQKQSSFETYEPQPVTFELGSTSHLPDGRVSRVVIDQVVVLYCRNCQQGVVVVEERRVEDRSWRDPQPEPPSGTITFRGIHWWPSPEARVSDDVPRDIAEAFEEAIRALHADCPRAAAVMLRRALEAVTVDKGEAQGTLAERLKRLSSNGMLVPSLADWAKEVRLLVRLPPGLTQTVKTQFAVR